MAHICIISSWFCNPQCLSARAWCVSTQCIPGEHTHSCLPACSPTLLHSMFLPYPTPFSSPSLHFTTLHLILLFIFPYLLFPLFIIYYSLHFPCITSLFNPQKGISVLHYANVGMVNGPAIDTNEDTTSRKTANIPSLLAFPVPAGRNDKSSTQASKLKVGPGLLEPAYKRGMRRLYSNYWVVAAGADSFGGVIARAQVPAGEAEGRPYRGGPWRWCNHPVASFHLPGLRLRTALAMQSDHTLRREACAVYTATMVHGCR